ncbi:ABC-2 type transport system ATP-binding protein [Jatrophihabitans endophyticus]|uniref:ABC-2 type transport system ATP-binding protein n=2 Tax=Jatrophihabitans endophyticus TaxID=1206085 RepID=A0A1M5H2E7_9ACTN|nr:ATP-binding cassette domain-containing protein [Jatrophihabitans endophyticus]SHG10179.1 ABC-2 type transport system ATP-binding protein [Jatrophihabitans endophyticus]
MGDTMISARGLARSFKTKSGPVHAVRGIDLDVRAGEIVGLLGPNGAGKTTTLRMLTTLLMPSEGHATVAGKDLIREPREVRRRIGYVAQVGAAPSAGTLVGEELVTQGRLQGLAKAEATARLAEVAPRLDLGGLEGRALLELSGGQRRRFDVALGLMHSPPLVFLDEPTTGLDPQSRANLWQHIRGLRGDMGVTVVITTHYLDEADALADRVLVMDGGAIVADDTPDALKARISGDVVTLEFAPDQPRERAEEVVRQAMEVREVVTTETAVLVTVDSGATAVAPILRALDAAGLSPASIAVNRPTLDDVFLTLTGRSLRDEAA